jgi:hypothetical protein
MQEKQPKVAIYLNEQISPQDVSLAYMKMDVLKNHWLSLPHSFKKTDIVTLVAHGRHPHMATTPVGKTGHTDRPLSLEISTILALTENTQRNQSKLQPLVL